MDANLEAYYQGSLYTPEGFKGFPPNATASEISYICSQVHEAHIECKQPTPAVITSLPAVGGHDLLFIALLTLVVVKVAYSSRVQSLRRYFG